MNHNIDMSALMSEDKFGVNMIMDRIMVERTKAFNSTIVGEIQQIATEHGIDTNIVINEVLIVEALRKQIPRKVKRCKKKTDDWLLQGYLVEGETLRWNECPECGQHVHTTDKFCRKCGQALDWGSEE